jgi:hypothetical protein
MTDKPIKINKAAQRQSVRVNPHVPMAVAN